MQKTFELPTTIRELRNTFDHVLLCNCNTAIFDFKSGHVTVIDPVDTAALDQQRIGPTDGDISFLLSKIPVKETGDEYVGANTKALNRLFNECLILSVDNLVPLGIIVSDKDILRSWLEVPKFIRLESIFGVRIFEYPTLDRSLLLLVGGKYTATSLRAAKVLRKLVMEVPNDSQ